MSLCLQSRIQRLMAEVNNTVTKAQDNTGEELMENTTPTDTPIKNVNIENLQKE